MTENKNVCEEIEIALYSDTELTEEQKKHMENCESCRALLSQINEMKSGLGTLCVPGLNDGDIAKAVMERVTKEAAPVPFPKFKLTHHLGTAAAIVIILAAVLILKNPSEPDFENESNDTAVTFTVPTQNNHVLSGVNTSGEEVTDDEVVEYTDKADEAQSYEAEYEKEEAVIMRSFAVPEENIANNAAENGNSGQNAANYSYYSYSADADSASLVADKTEDTEEQAAPQATAEEADGEMITVPSSKSTSARGGGSSGGSSEAAAKKEAQTETNAANEYVTTESVQEDYNSYTDATAESLEDDAGILSAGTEARYIFEGIEFSENDDDFEYNVSLANNRLYELYEGKYVLSVKKLTSLGVDNKMLLELAPKITQKMFDFYKTSLDIFE